MTRSTLSLAGEAGESGDSTSAGTGSRGRSRIPQSEWPRIVQRQQRGDSKSAIARDYNCTPAAIAYILKKAEQAGVAPAEDSLPAGGSAGTAARDAGPGDKGAPQADKGADGQRSGGRMTLRAPDKAHASGADEAPAAAASPGGESPAAAPAAPAPEPAGGRGAGQGGSAPSGGAADDGERDSLQQRLSDTTRQLDQAYRTWCRSHDEDAVSDLRASVHEMRKVLARFEVEIAASRQHEQSVEPFRYPGERGRWQSSDGEGAPRGTSKRAKK